MGSREHAHIPYIRWRHPLRRVRLACATRTCGRRQPGMACCALLMKEPGGSGGSGERRTHQRHPTLFSWSFVHLRLIKPPRGGGRRQLPPPALRPRNCPPLCGAARAALASCPLASRYLCWKHSVLGVYLKQPCQRLARPRGLGFRDEPPVLFSGALAIATYRHIRDGYGGMWYRHIYIDVLWNVCERAALPVGVASTRMDCGGRFG